MAKDVEIDNVLAGPGWVYIDSYGGTATEPTNADVQDDYDPETDGWTFIGGTMDGVELKTAYDTLNLEVDQVIDSLGKRITGRKITLKTNLAEVTLENLAIALNRMGDVVTDVPNAVKTLVPKNDIEAVQPVYTRVLFQGAAPSGHKRFLVARRCFNTDDIVEQYTKKDQTVFAVTWELHYVSNTVEPYKRWDVTA